MGDDNGGAIERSRSAPKKQRQATTRLAGVLLSSIRNRPEPRHLRKRESVSVARPMPIFTFSKMTEATGPRGRIGICGAERRSERPLPESKHMTVAFPGHRKRAFITGITRQDGSYLAELLISKNYEVHGIKRRSSSFNTERVDHLISDWHERDAGFFLHLRTCLTPPAYPNCFAASHRTKSITWARRATCA
jgi:hypothetical protein